MPTICIILLAHFNPLSFLGSFFIFEPKPSIMPQASNEHKRLRRAPNQHKPAAASVSEAKQNHRRMNGAGAETESRRNPRKAKKRNKMIMCGMDCKGTIPMSPAAAIKKPMMDVCCTPPGIGIGIAPNQTNTARFDHRKTFREGSRNGNAAIIGSRTNHRSAEAIIQMLMSQQALLPDRILYWNDQYNSWRLNVDDMSYEELVDLGDRIGYVGSGLHEEEITTCLRKSKPSISNPWFMYAGKKDWKCSICQEKCRRADEIGRLDCGHYHHMQCIKQWLLHKNQCPVCKSAAIPK